MRAICVYRDNQDYSRSVSDWLEDFYRQTSHQIETMDPDQNTSFCETYSIVEYPTIIVLGNNGEVLASWQGRDLPLMNEVLFFMV